MKIAVTGKGGVGKTTISAVLARLYAEEGKKVFAVDVDPDANLGLALGFSEEELESITPVSKMRRLIEERTGADKSNTFYKVNPKVDDIPEIYGKENNGVRLLVLGTVETAGGGCVCPENVMLKRIINNLVLHRDDIVILDMEAGLEHLGRGTTEGMDQFIVVIEPGARSVQTYKNVKRLAEELGVKEVKVIANKIRNERRLIFSVNEVLNDGRTPKVRLHTDKKFKKIQRIFLEMPEGTKCEVVEQECTACGKKFRVMYSEDGIIRFFGDECACEAEFSPIGPSISEWLEEVKEKGR